MLSRHLLVCLSAVGISVASGVVLQVAVTGADTGGCQDMPCATIKYAILQASSGDTIELGEGVFKGSGNRNIKLGTSSSDPADLKIKSVAGPKQTILNLQAGGRGFEIGEFAGQAVVEGISLVNGSCAALTSTDDNNGAGFHLTKSHALLRNLHISHMDCTVEGVEYTKWSGAAIYLKDSHAVVDGVEVVDVVANHGGGVAAWGNDRSKILNSNFLRGGGLRWAGCMLMEDNVSTEFHNCSFSYSYCAYGAALDDGATAHPLYKNCTFEYGEALYGGAAYHYGQSKTRFEQVIFQHNVMNAATVYINAETKPEIINCTFYNNTANGESGAIRSYYTGEDGPLEINQVRFIANTARMMGGAMMVTSNIEFNDCLFESNSAETDGGALAIMAGYGAGHGIVLRRTYFARNHADSDGGALHLLPAQAPEEYHQLSIEDSSFVENTADNSGGAITIKWPLEMSILSSTFSNNVAGVTGGALHMSNILMPMELKVQINDTTLKGNRASGGGGAISCDEPVPAETSLSMHRFTVAGSQTYGDGAAVHYSCSRLELMGGTFENNSALEGDGGVFSISKQLGCAEGKARIEDVNLHNNYAFEGGGALFFDHVNPTCKVPLLPDGVSWNASATEVWSWSNFKSAVHGNKATYGALQATAPSEVSLACGSGNAGCKEGPTGTVVMHGFPGIELHLTVALIDDFGQRIVAPGLQMEVVLVGGSAQTESYLLQGIQRHGLEGGTARINALYLLGGKANDTSTVPLTARIPRGMAALQHVKPASLHVAMGSCPAGFRKGVDADTGARKCHICSSGFFSEIDASACIACDAGKYASQVGSSVCSVCPAGHGCPPGTTNPVPCSEGFNQPSNGSAACDRCIKGTYQDEKGKTTCTACAATQTTQGPGSVSAADCDCPPGSYKKEDAGTVRCHQCVDGLHCTGYGGQVTVMPGFYAKLPVDPSAGVWVCSNTKVCKGQTDPDDQVCATNSEGLNCALCKEGTTPGSDGLCEECGGSGTALLPLFMFLSFVLCGVFHYAWNHRTSSVELVESVLMSITIGVTLAFMQQVGIMDQLSFTWPKEFQAILKVVSLFLFDLDVLKMGCVVPQSFPSSYLSGLVMPSLIAAFFSLWYFLSKLFHMLSEKFPAFGWSAILNSIGMVMQALYISVVSATVSLFMCYESGPDLERVLTNYPWERCYNSAWMSMLPFGILGLFAYVIGFFALLVWLSKVAPQKWIDPEFRTKVRFLVFKFRTNRWWYGVWLLLRSLAMALVPVVSPDDGYVQFFLLLFILVGSLVVHLRCEPYQDLYANLLESIELSILVVILAVGSWFIEDREYEGDDKAMSYRLSIVLCASFVMCALALLGTFTYATRMMLRPALTLQTQEKKIRQVRDDYVTSISKFMSLDDANQLKVLSEASYVDLQHMIFIASFKDTIVQGKGSRRLSDRSFSRSQSQLDLAGGRPSSEGEAQEIDKESEYEVTL